MMPGGPAGPTGPCFPVSPWKRTKYVIQQSQYADRLFTYVPATSAKLSADSPWAST